MPPTLAARQAADTDPPPAKPARSAAAGQSPHGGTRALRPRRTASRDRPPPWRTGSRIRRRGRIREPVRQGGGRSRLAVRRGRSARVPPCGDWPAAADRAGFAGGGSVSAACRAARVGGIHYLATVLRYWDARAAGAIRTGGPRVIVTRTPFRISFAGGGSDLAAF